MDRTDTLAPGFLVASPKLDGSVFERSVIVMIHHDQEGAMGFIVNKPLEVDFGSLLEMVEIDRGRIDRACYERHVFFGGPVRVEQLWVIHEDAAESSRVGGIEELDETAELRFHDQWRLTGTADSIEEFAFGDNVASFRPYIGYTGWGPGQLETEIEEGSWLMLDFDEDLVFGLELETSWNAALERLGIDETTFMMMGKAGHA